MDVQPTNLRQLCDAIMSIWTKLSEECFEDLVESMLPRIEAVLKAKGGPTRYEHGVPNKVAGECMYICSSKWKCNLYLVFRKVCFVYTYTHRPLY